MNILQLVPNLNIGGVERGTVEVARYLTLNGHKAVVVSGGGRLEKNLAAVGARHYTLPVGKKNPLSMIYCYYKMRRIIKKENIDIVHARSRIPALTGYFASRAERKTFITTAHGQYKKHLISRVMGWGKVVIVASDVMAQHMKENFGVLPHKIVVIPRGVDLNKFTFRQPAEKRGEPFRIGMVSRFTPIKGHLDFLKAAAYVSRKIPKLEVVMMGDRATAKQEYIKKIELTMRHLLIDKIVKFKDPNDGVPKVLEELDVLVSASTGQEAFGRSVIEAQAKGVPVVATRVGGVAETVEDGVTGILCDPSNPSDMAKKIMLYADDLALRKRVAGNAVKNLEKEYSLDKMLRSILATYERTLSTRNIIVYKISSLGDIILSIPSLRAIRKKFRDSTIKVLVDVRFRKVLEKCQYIDEVISCDFRARDRGLGFLRLASRIKAEDFDISIDLQNNRKSHLLAYLSMIPERYGYDNRKMSFLLNCRTSMPKKALGPVEHQARVLGLLGITSVEDRLELWPDEESLIWVDKLLKSNWLKEGQKLVGISLSASKKWKTKNWGIASFQHLADLLAKKGIRVVLIGSEDDRPEAEKFIKKTAAKPINAVGKTDISQLTALVARCNALVAGDSSPVHIAAAVGTPFVAIFGPTDPARHLPPAKRYRLIAKKTRCAPCYKNVCYKRHKCMTAIKPDEVLNSVLEVIK